ncbi:hypothetical protein LAZ29_07170 [Cereibacter sphaeroides]|uniref:hypothetical protein n=1 Tax=Cereibacter sphaeroides TaxID=1063 RepID=UPI001F17CBAA|nr:hypothetical protein [Cereibacter sphaeroides]MCE6950706.1 hypothetical protein [Cereibacter sphaeroides]
MEETLEARAERAVAQGCAVAAAVRAHHLQRCASRGGLPAVCLRRLELGKVFDDADDGPLAGLCAELERQLAEHVVGYRYPWDGCDDVVDHDPLGVEPTIIYDADGERLRQVYDLVHSFIRLREGVRYAVIGLRELGRLIEMA